MNCSNMEKVMKILWLVNIMLPELSAHLGQQGTVFGGWLIGARDGVCASGNKLVICTTGKNSGRYEIAGITYYIVRDDQREMSSVLEQEKPDVVHIYGTEFPHAYTMACVSDPKRRLVTIQGAMTYCKDLVYAGIPESICRDRTLHKVLRALHKGGQSIDLQRQSFQHRAALEKQILLSSRYVSGGSHWGDVVARSINPDCRIMSCGLVLRPVFYTEERWRLDSCERHSVYTLFSYPIKGFHMFLEALRLVVMRFPDTKVYVSANKLPIRRYSGLKKKLMDAAPDYNWYVQGLIEKYALQDHLIFLGYLNADQVKEYMIRSHVFVSASAIENQSTTLGEAMILGVPSIASCVGAIQEIIQDGQNGFVYPFSEPYLLADKIMTIFTEDNLAEQFSSMGRKRAMRVYDRTVNIQRLLDIYKTIKEAL